MYTMKNKLLIWDWKFRCYFDSEVADSVLEFITHLNQNEQRVYTKLLNYYTSHFSFQQLLDAIDSDLSKEKVYLDKANSNIDQMYTMPKGLFTYYRKKVTEGNYTYKEELILLLRKSVSLQNNQAKDKFAVSVLVPIFGSHFISSMRKYVKAKSGSPKVQGLKNQIPVAELRGYCTNKIIKYQKDSHTIQKYGKFHNDFSMKFTKDTDHYGEYWDRDLTDKDKDLLVIAVNKSSICQKNLDSTLVHEVYPGHSHFYNRLAHNQFPFDHGATALIEGWATFCEYDAKGYKGLPNNYRLLVKYLLRLDKPHQFEESCNKIYEIMLAESGSKNIALSTLISATQYRGYLESYYIGAMWLLTYCNKTGKTPSYFLNKLSNRNVGDLFNAYHKDLTID